MYLFSLTASVHTLRSSKGTSWYTATNLSMLKEETFQQKDIKGSTPVFANTNAFPITEKPLQNNVMNTSYLLAGVGVVMSMLLFIIVIEIYKKCQGTKCTSELRKIVNQYSNENFNQQPDETSNQLNSFNIQQDTVNVNNETDQSMDIMQHSDYTNTATYLRVHISPLKFQDSANLQKDTSF